MSKSLVTINLVVLNGDKYILHCLDGVLAQTYLHELIEFNVLDNGSSDGTKSVIENFKLKIKNSKFFGFKFIEGQKNLGMWPGQEELLKHTNGEYVLTMAVDVILDKDFVKNAVAIFEKDEKIGGVEPKIYRYELSELRITNYELKKKIIDTVGFQIYKSRRVVNMGHGEEEKGQFSKEMAIFGVEGAAPMFRRKALEDCRISFTGKTRENTGLACGEIFDHDFFWYGDDLDLAWRMNMFGWRQIFSPDVVAWHDRQTTKGLRKSWSDFIKLRRQIPIKKRRLDWRNTRFTIIKNDYTINILKDLPRILKREIMMFGYIIIFEPEVLLEIPNFLRLLPKMLKSREEILKRAVIKPEIIHKWFK